MPERENSESTAETIGPFPSPTKASGNNPTSERREWFRRLNNLLNLPQSVTQTVTLELCAREIFALRITCALYREVRRMQKEKVKETTLSEKSVKGSSHQP